MIVKCLFALKSVFKIDGAKFLEDIHLDVASIFELGSSQEEVH